MGIEAKLSGEEGYEFSPEAIEVLLSALAEAQSFNHKYIGTEHILLGLTHSEEGARILRRYKLTIDKMRSAVEFIVGRDNKVAKDEIEPTPGAKKVIELAVRHALDDNREAIKPKDLIIGLILEGEGLAAGILQKLGASYESISKDPELQSYRDRTAISLNELEKGLADPNVEQWQKEVVLSIVEKATEIFGHRQNT